MDTRNGKIYQGNADEIIELKKQIGSLTELTNQEFRRLQSFSEEQRPEELAFSRFMEQRKALRAPSNAHIQNAFRLGYRAAKTDNK